MRILPLYVCIASALAVVRGDNFKDEKVKVGKRVCTCSFYFQLKGTSCTGKGKCDKKCSGLVNAEISKYTFRLKVKNGRATISNCKVKQVPKPEAVSKCIRGFTQVCPMVQGTCPEDMEMVCPINAQTRMANGNGQDRNSECQCIPDFLISLVTPEMVPALSRIIENDQISAMETIKVGKRMCKCTFKMEVDGTSCLKSQGTCDKKCNGEAKNTEIKKGIYVLDMAVKRGKVKIKKCQVKVPEINGTGSEGNTNEENEPSCSCITMGKMITDGQESGGSISTTTHTTTSTTSTSTISTTITTTTKPITDMISTCPSNSELLDDSTIFIAGGLRTEVTVLSEQTLTNFGVQLSPLPKKSWGPALAYHNGFVYHCGQVFATEENICMRYDRTINMWTEIADLPYINAYSAGESVNGNLFVFGGNGGKRNVLKYNANDDSWAILPAKIPFDFVSGCSTVLAGCKVLLINLSGKVAVFNGITETFETSPGFPSISATVHHCAATLGQRSNSIGIMVAARGKTVFYQLEPPGPAQWESFPTNNFYLGPVLGRISKNMMILGDNTNNIVRNEVFSNFSPSWEDKDYDIPFPTYGRSTQVPKSWIETNKCLPISSLLDDSIMFIAGGLQLDVSVMKGPNPKTKDLAPLPKKSWGPALVYHDDGYVYHCGQVAFNQENLCMKYDRTANVWTSIADLPYVNGWCTGESVNGKIFLFGGSGGLRNVLSYNTATNSWTVLAAKIPFDFQRGCSTVIGSCKVLLISTSGETAVFDASNEIFEDNTNIPNIGSNSHSAARIASVKGNVGIMVHTGGSTKFLSLSPSTSTSWESFPTNNGYLGPVLGRLSSDILMLGGAVNFVVRDETFQSDQAAWNNLDIKTLPFPTYGSSVQVPKEWWN